MVDSPPVRAIVMSTLPSHDSRESLLEQYRSCSTDSSNSTDGSRLSDARAVEQPHHRDPHLDRSVESDVLPETAVLGRNIGWSSAYILIISRVIGSGIFATPGPIVRSVGSIGITLVLWVVGALISWFGLAITREYGCMLPRSGGDKVYLKFTYRWPRYLATVLIAVQSILLGFTASNCIVFAEYVLFARGTEASQFEQKALAVGLLTAVVVTHSCLMKTGIFIQNVPGWVKIVLVVFMVFTSLFAVIFRPNVVRDEAQDSSPTTSSKSSLWDGSVWNWGVISTALFKVFYSYAGLQNVNNVPNEVKNPVKTLKSAASTALLTACFLYLLVNVAYFLIVPIEEIKNSGELIAALFFERLFGARVGRILLPSAVAISAAGNVMVVTFSHKSHDKAFYRFPTSSRRRNLSMHRWALVTHFIPSFLVICIPAGNIYSFILDVEGYSGQIFALASSLGVIWLRFNRPDLRRPYKAFLLAVWIRIALSIPLLVAPFVPRARLDWTQHLKQVSYEFVGTLIMLFGVMYLYVWTVLLPQWNGYKLVEDVEVLDDGTTVTKLIKVPLKDTSLG